MKPARKIVLVVALALLAGGGGWFYFAGKTRGVVIAALPPAPDIGPLPGELQRQLTHAGNRARGWLAPRRGLVALSQLYHANGFLAEAMQCYGGLENLEPTEPRWPHLHATILAGYGEIEPALKLWQRVLQLAPGYVAARLRVGDCLLKANRPAEAFAAYEEVLRQDPGNAYALLGLARIDLEAQRWDSARERLETVVQKTNFNLGYDLIVSLYERLGQNERAAQIRGAAKASGAYRDAPDPWLDELLNSCLDPYRLALSAGVDARMGDTATAAKLLAKAIALSPDDVSAHFQLGGLDVAVGDTKAARDQFETCTRLAPAFADGWAQLSTLEAKDGNQPAAERALAAGLAACPDSPGLHLLRAHNLTKAGQVGEAMAELRQSIRLRPNEPEAYVELANLYLAQGRDDEAVEQLHAALEADPGEPIALSILAFHAITTGVEADAGRWLTRVSLQPRVPRDQWGKLAAAYRQAFGHDWTPVR